jgi:ubiquinone/menaquinone biosynthesis C-methylase UbiE
MLPKNDRTPDSYRFIETTLRVKIVRCVRRIIYPFITSVRSVWLARLYNYASFTPDLWLYGQRGNDYQAQRRRVNKYITISDSRVLVAGCGTGNDIESWLAWRPKELLGVDYFDYGKAWRTIIDTSKKNKISTQVGFLQADLEKLQSIPPNSFDIVGSDAVFEHVKNLDLVLAEFWRVLRPGGLIYATFGPLWCCWGGDHWSGGEVKEDGYNHLLLDEKEYKEKLDRLGDFFHSENDARTWLYNDLFSYLKPNEYIDCLEKAKFKRIFLAAIVEPRALEVLNQNSDLATKLYEKHSFLDLTVTGMTVIFKKCE